MKSTRSSFIRATVYSQWAYLVMLGICWWAQTHVPPSPVRTVLTLSPILPGIFIIAVTIWQYQACDEYIRSKILAAAACVATLTALWTLIYSYLELIGFPKLSMMWVSNAGWLVFVAMMIRLMLGAREESAA